MADKELLSAISEMMDQKLQPIREDVAELKTGVAELKTDVAELKMKTAGISLHLENVTDRNISILAENHLALVDKLNQAVKVQDKDLIREVQMSILKDKVDKLEQEMIHIKSKIA